MKIRPPKRKSIADARTNLPQLIRDAESGHPVELTRRGESVAVLLGRAEYERLSRGALNFSLAWEAFTHRFDVASLNIDPDEVFADVRDQSPGRDAGL